MSAAASAAVSAAACAVAVLAMACAAAGTNAPRDRALLARDVPTFTRRIAPFPVADSAGRAYREPFLGGFDVPRPQLVDLDGDGDLDLLVQERSNALMHFENDGGTFRWRSDRYADLPVGEWYRFVDLDGDGLVDVLSESPVSFIRAWRNVGSAGAPRFEIAADSVRDAAGYPIPADRQNILGVGDLDCNGRLDLLLGRVDGTVDRYEAERTPEAGRVPRFALHTTRFEDIEIVGPIPGSPGDAGAAAAGGADAAPFDPFALTHGSARHGANTIAIADTDGDGLPDILWGDYFEAGLLRIPNRAPRCGSPDFRATPRRFPDSTRLVTSGYNAPAPGDLDGDGRLDLVMGVIGGAYGPRTTAIDNLWLVRQPVQDSFVVETSRLLRTLDVGSDAVPTLGDLDGDGDLDLLVGNRISVSTDATGDLMWFENTGTPTQPAFTERGRLPLSGEFHYAPAIVDLDGDGRNDLVVGTFRDKLQWWRNTGTRGAPQLELADSALVTITRGSNTVPAFADLDGDGDADLVIGESSGQLNLYRNEGTRTAPRFELVSDTLGGIDVGRRSAPAFLDVDGDGAVDLLLGREEGGVRWWRNVSTRDAIRFAAVEAPLVETPNFSAPAVGDLDGDGRADLVVGVVSGGLFYFSGGAAGGASSGDASGSAPSTRPGSSGSGSAP